MKIEITYKYSDLDNDPQFGIYIYNYNSAFETYIRWVYYYLGCYFGENKPTLYPFYILDGKVMRTYKFCNNAQRQAKLIYDAISKQLQKYR